MITQRESDNKKTYDVAILGTGIGGSMLGAILARHGAKVLLIDAGQHPRFAVGESTIPYTLLTLRILADRYDVPEIKALATFTDASRTIGNTFGVKKNFGFLLHHENQPQDPREVSQFSTPGLLHEAAHLHRQDTDAYLFHVAIRYGCTARQNCRVTEVEFDDSGVTIDTARGEQFRARYLVDASGFRSPLAEKFGLREDPCRFKHHSRSLWTHMLDVTPTDEVFDRPRKHRPPTRWYQGTVHHMFERGWFWVIAFDNNKLSSNPLCSVGLTLDERRYPKPADISPEEDFYRHAARFPDVARQYEGAKAAREWVSTPRLQYSSSHTVGDRWCLLAHAAGFIDPLFSRGMSNTAEAINSLAWRLIRAVKDDDFSAERFEYVDRLQQRLLNHNDELVNAAFISWCDYDLWSAVFRAWASGTNAGSYRLQKAITDFTRDGRDEHFMALEDPPNLGLYWPDHDGFAKFFQSMVSLCDSVEQGTLSPRHAADGIYDQLREADFIPKHFGFAERGHRFINPTPIQFVKTVRWAMREGDPKLRDLTIGNAKEALKARLKGQKLY